MLRIDDVTLPIIFNCCLNELGVGFKGVYRRGGGGKGDSATPRPVKGGTKSFHTFQIL